MSNPPPRREWIFLLLLGAFCSAFLWLHSRWAGELALAERSQRESSNRKSVETFCRAFDLELKSACAEIIPDIESGILDSAPTFEQLSANASRAKRPVFKSVAVVELDDLGHDIRVWQRGKGEVAVDELTGIWKHLDEGLTLDPMRPPPPPMEHRDAYILMFPTSRFPSGPEEMHLPRKVLLLEIDPDFLTDVWIPELLEHYLFSPASTQQPDVVISTKMGMTLFSRHEEGAKDPPVTVHFNRRGRSTLWMKGPPSEPVWRIDVSWPVGPLLKLESDSKRRNILLGISATGLVFFSGIMLAKQSIRMRQIAEERVRFVANVSHEFRTPLTVISGAAFNLNRGVVETPEEIREYSQLILDHSEQLGCLVGSALELSRLRSGAPALDLQNIDPKEVLELAANDLGDAMGSMRLEITHECPGVILRGNALSIRSLFRNLLDNACKYARDGGWIGVHLKAGKSTLEISIRDRGPGFPPHERARIFEPFYRGSSTHPTRGSGLGLALARDIARAHGGDLVVSSTAGSGTCFVITLPIMDKSDE